MFVSLVYVQCAQVFVTGSLHLLGDERQTFLYVQYTTCVHEHDSKYSTIVPAVGTDMNSYFEIFNWG